MPGHAKQLSLDFQRGALNELIDRLPLARREKTLLCALIWLAKENIGRPHSVTVLDDGTVMLSPTLDELAAASELSKRSVQRAVQWLDDSDFVDVDRSEHRPHVYTVHWPLILNAPCNEAPARGDRRRRSPFRLPTTKGDNEGCQPGVTERSDRGDNEGRQPGVTGVTERGDRGDNEGCQKTPLGVTARGDKIAAESPLDDGRQAALTLYRLGRKPPERAGDSSGGVTGRGDREGRQPGVTAPHDHDHEMNEYKNHDHDEGPRYDPSTGHPSFGGWPIAITEPMLTHLGHVQALYEFALQQPRWNLAHSESTRLGFFSAAVQAASGNSPGRLFTKLVKDRAWLNLDGRGGISKQSEERARKGLQKLDRPPVLPAPATVQLAESIEQRHTESQINDTTKGASNVQ